MMYLFDFFKFLFSSLEEIFSFVGSIFGSAIEAVEHLLALIGALPVWLSVPFMIILEIALIFRISQFIPTIGGAS